MSRYEKEKKKSLFLLFLSFYLESNFFILLFFFFIFLLSINVFCFCWLSIRMYLSLLTSSLNLFSLSHSLFWQKFSFLFTENVKIFFIFYNPMHHPAVVDGRIVFNTFQFFFSAILSYNSFHSFICCSSFYFDQFWRLVFIIVHFHFPVLLDFYPHFLFLFSY